jgi:hypothetical protein
VSLKKQKPGIVYGPEYRPDYAKYKRLRWCENVSDGLRLVGLAHEVAKREGMRFDHTGWYMDEFHDGELAVGVIYQLPARGGVPQYVFGMADPYNHDCALLNFHYITDDLLDAIRYSDSMAERYAEAEREYQEQERARVEAEEREEQERLEAEVETQHELESEVL